MLMLKNSFFNAELTSPYQQNFIFSSFKKLFLILLKLNGNHVFQKRSQRCKPKQIYKEMSLLQNFSTYQSN